jgi:hypothetical protein
MGATRIKQIGCPADFKTEFLKQDRALTNGTFVTLRDFMMNMEKLFPQPDSGSRFNTNSTSVGNSNRSGSSNSRSNNSSSNLYSSWKLVSTVLRLMTLTLLV